MGSTSTTTPPSVQRAKDGAAEAVAAQERCYELSFAVQEACKGAARLCAGQWAQLRVDMQMQALQRFPALFGG